MMVCRWQVLHPALDSEVVLLSRANIRRRLKQVWSGDKMKGVSSLTMSPTVVCARWVAQGFGGFESEVQTFKPMLATARETQ